tara:strand:- start:165 stop:548 length:384 start_codon:yes stop_codon:yes gene_type:complete
MDRTTGRPNHIEDYLTQLYPNQWFTWTDSKNKVYANLRLTTEYGVNGSMVTNPRSLPSESDCTTGLINLQKAWDLENDSYKSKRRAEYPQLAEQFDLLYKDIVAGTVTTNGDFAKAIKAVKDKYSKE